MKNFNKVPLIQMLILAVVSAFVSLTVIAILLVVATGIVIALSNPPGLMLAFFICFVITFTSVLYLVSGGDE